MKKQCSITIVVFVLLILSSTATASGWGKSEGSCFAQGDKLGSVGLSFHYFGLYAAFDYALHDCISAGAAFGYVGYSLLDTRHHHLPIMARVAFHPFNLSALADKVVFRDMIDVYLGISTGWVAVWVKRDNISLADETDKSGFRIREYLGMRYHFTPKWSFFIEHSAYLTDIAGGVSYKF